MKHISHYLKQTMVRLEQKQEKPLFRLSRDGNEIMIGTESEILEYMHRNTTQSLDWNCKHEGYKIEEIK